jgi:hypothetical protein
MKRWERAIEIVLLVALTTSLAGCFYLSGQEATQQVFNSPIDLPTRDLPTVTPRPTWPPPPRGTLIPKATLTPTPTPIRPLLTPVPTGTPSEELQAILYVADNNGRPELREIGVDAQGRRWSDSDLLIDLPLGNLVGLQVSPDGRFIAVEVATGDQPLVRVVKLSSGKVWCPLVEPAECTGGFWDWTLDSRILFRPFDVQPDDVILGGVLVVNLDTSEYNQLHLPTQPRWGYSLVHNVSLSPEGSRLAYSITYWGNEGEISEVWTVGMDGKNKQLVHMVDGVINTLSWSPVAEPLIYVYQKKPGQFLPSELRLLNIDGSGERYLASNLPMPSERHYRPVWSPDGSKVAFVQLDDSITFYNTLGEPWSNVYVVDTTTGEITKLSTFEKLDVSYPTWSPDGKFVAFAAATTVDEETHYGEVWVASVDGSQLFAVSDATRWHNALAWLPSLPSMERR